MLEIDSVEAVIDWVNSGMGKYHGRWGFEAFTNARGVLYHSASIDPGVKYPPYSEHVRERAVLDNLM